MTENLTAEAIRARSKQFLPDAATIMARETWRREQLAAVTYGIEIRGISVMLAVDYDRIAETVDPHTGTCDPVIDEFYLTKFSPMTTRWIHDHPMLPEIAKAFDRYVLIMRGHFDFDRPKYRDRLKQKT